MILTEELFGDFGLGEDEAWEDGGRKPALVEGTYTFIIESSEEVGSANSDWVKLRFKLIPYLDSIGLPVDALSQTLRLNADYFVGKKRDGVLYERAKGNQLQTFLISIDVTPQALPELRDRETNRWMFTQDTIKGILVTGKVVWNKTLSKYPDPHTGKVPEAIDESNPYTYSTWANIADNSLRGVRNEEDLSVKRVNI